ncbi:MAG TPA: UDP-N-acetylmuramoyl-L-alanyl-D-glutamate--2,6-diaminopimelate ligase [Gaiellaceae bacterium]|nr:UDP-N-acetylmuramoyl-L-alanyl-D-glutamate--2,6-diaminopimelate ligase [Gaiellaceae bacterium]
MDLERVIAALAPETVANPRPVAVGELAYDSRAVVPGTLFFCVPGERADGHDFAGDAVERGAVALVVERPLEFAVPQLVVHDARAAMAVAAVEFFDDPSRDLHVAGVTGTNGKTTTCFLLFAVLAAAGRRPGLLGTIESRVGGERRPAMRTTPEAIDVQRALREMLDVGDRSCAMEATSHGAQLGRLDGVRFSALAFTNLSRDHLDFHGTFEEYFDAKRSLFVRDEPPPAALNVDDEYGRRLAAELRELGHGRLLTFGIEADADVRATEVELRPDGTRLTAGGIALRTELVGRFNVENVLAAVTVARLLDLPDGAIAAGIDAVREVPGRFELVDEGQPFSVVVDYAHTPDSLANALRAARELATGRVICVFGCGGDRDPGKRPLMGAAAVQGADVVLVTSDNPRSEPPEAIAAEITAGIDGEVEVELDRARAIELAIEQAEPGDVVVVAGKGHEQGQEVAGTTTPFDDRDVARETLRRLAAEA